MALRPRGHKGPLPCQRCLRALGDEPDLVCGGAVAGPCARCKRLKKSAADCKVVPTEQESLAREVVGKVRSRSEGWEEAVVSLDMAMRRRQAPRSVDHLGESVGATPVQQTEPALMSGALGWGSERPPARHGVPGPLFNANQAARPDTFTGPYGSRGLSAPGYGDLMGLAPARDDRLVRLVRRVSEAQRDLDDYVRVFYG